MAAVRRRLTLQGGKFFFISMIGSDVKKSVAEGRERPGEKRGKEEGEGRERSWEDGDRTRCLVK